MYGRLIEIEGIEPSRREEVTSTIRERVITEMRDAGGFAGFISLVDDERRRTRNVVLWETRESAEEFERRWASRREEIVRGFGGTILSADLYDAPIVEIGTGARA